MIQTIIFDLGGVVFADGTKAFADSLAKRLGKSLQEVSAMLTGDLATEWRKGRVSEEVFFTDLTKKLQLPLDPLSLSREWISGYTLVHGMKELIEELSISNTLYYLSDSVQSRVEKLEGMYHFLSWFNGGIFSYDVGIRKPDEAIYTLLVKKFSLVPNECLYIDDKEKNLIPASELGMATHLFTSPEEFGKELVRLDLIRV